MSNYIKAALVLCVVTCVAVIAGLTTGGASAREPKRWVSVDSTELARITNSEALAASHLNERVERIVSGIAILRLTEAEMENLSGAMHQTFNKCSGFVEHSSEAEAIAWVENMNTADAPDVTYSIDNGPVVNDMLSGVVEAQNRQVIADLSAFPNRRYNQPSGLESATWIKNKWTELAGGRRGVSVEFYDHPSSTSPQPSVILTITGSTFPNEIVVIGAHQDSINQSGSTAPAPGADDDASGVACLTETIRVLMAKSFRPMRTIQFMAYAAEEVGLRGSNAIATAYRNANKNVIGVLQLDMTNYKGTLGNDIVIINDFTNAAQNQFVRNLITTYQPNLVIGSSSCGYACSDHASWHNKSYAASMPFEATLSDDNGTIHSSNDTLAFTGNNANHAVKFTKLAISFAGELAKGCVGRQVCMPPPAGDGRPAAFSAAN